MVTPSALSRTPSYAEAGRIQLTDRWYGSFATMVLVVGFLRFYYFETGQAFYSSNPFFQAKRGLFVLIGVLSIYPTIRFMRWRGRMGQGLAPTGSEREYRQIMLELRAEVLLVAMVLCARLMARGVRP